MNDIRIKIIDSDYGFKNLKFSSKPTTEMCEELKRNNWRYSKNNNCWYPGNYYARTLAETFSIQFKEKYDPESNKMEISDEVDENNKTNNNSTDSNLDNGSLAANIIQGSSSDTVNKNDIPEPLLIKSLFSAPSQELHQAIKENKGHEYIEKIANETEKTSVKKSLIELTAEDYRLARRVIPQNEYNTILSMINGEEGEFFQLKVKSIANTVRELQNLSEENTNPDGSHPCKLRYTLGDSEWYISELDKNGIGWGYVILNGDINMSEFGSISIYNNNTYEAGLTNLKIQTPITINGQVFSKEISPELDLYLEENTTIERELYKNYPEYFPEYEKYSNIEKEKTIDELKSELTTFIKESRFTEINKTINTLKTKADRTNYKSVIEDIITSGDPGALHSMVQAFTDNNIKFGRLLIEKDDEGNNIFHLAANSHILNSSVQDSMYDCLIKEFKDLYSERTGFSADEFIKENIDIPNAAGEIPSEIAKNISQTLSNNVNDCITKFDDIVRETFLKVPENNSEVTPEDRQLHYDKWYRPMVDEIMDQIKAGNQDIIKAVEKFDFNNKTHEGNLLYNKVQQNFLPELYQKVQDKIKAGYEEKKIPYVVLYWSESDVFPTENKIYPLNEFNDLILQADKEFYNRKQYAEKKYGSVENYWNLESENKLPEEDIGITFGYDKTRFKICNIPNPKNPEDTLSYEPSSYDIGDGNGSIFDDVRSTCSYDEVIEALNRVEINFYYSEVSDFQKKAVEKVIEAEKFVLKENLKENTKSLDKAQNEYKELHKKWLMDSSEVEKVDTNLKNATEAIKNTYDTSIKNVLSQIIDEYPLAVKDNPDFLKYTVNETKKMIISELYSPSRNAQKAMNDNKNIYENFDWKKLHLIWEQFPVNVNKTEYIEQKLEELCKEKGIGLNENVVSTSTLEPSPEEISNARKLVRDTQAEIAKKKYESEQGSNYDSNLSTTDIAKKLRDYVKKNYPDYKFSITSKYFSGGSEINVTLKQAPGEITNENIMKEYFEHNSAKEWWNNDTGKYEKYYEMTDEKKKEVIKYSVDRAYVFNNPSTEENPSWMSPEVNKVMMDVRRQLESYNFDHSDSQSDYYDVNFWSHYDISKEAVERSLKITRAPEKSLNFVLEKLSAAGIEVVQDKEEFDRILNSAEILQKMQEENKVEDLFVSVNDSNLETEIDKLTINDVNVYNKFINISKDTPFILKEFGLNNYPVNIYKQKLARALFLEKEKFGERLTHGHKGEFTEKEVKEVFKNISNPRYIFNSKQDETIPENFYLIGVYDVFDKMGNPMMLSFHFDKNKKEIEANWITAVYGKNLNVLVNDWVKKGFLLYKNDLEIENASEEAGALYMRVSNLQKHLGNIIRQKSDYVNENDVFFYKQNEQTYGFAYEGKIYLNPEIANSEVALHEYTHLWDSYTQITNPELWQKGKEIFKNTQFWEDVKADPNYADIADNEDLLLSEVHSQLCGKMADAILTKIAERDGELTKDTVIDWDKETWEYIATEIPELKNATEDLKEFLSMPMKDLMNGVEITKVINLNVDKDLQSKMKQLHKPKELQVYTFSPFGYEGALVQVETDLRRGIPAYDIVGISDGIIKETRERIQAAFNNSGLEFPSERVLQSLSPADLKKDSPLDLSMALDILGKTQNYPVDGSVLALGELELSGEIRPVRGAVAAVNSALACGISNIICDPTTAELLKDIHGIKILAVENLKEAHEKLQEINSFKLTEPHIVNKNHVEFVESDYIKESLENLSMDGHFETVRAIEVAVAGKHNILTTGAPGCGKTMLMQALMPALTPKLTEDEIITPRRIASIAGLDSPNRDIHIPPFRMPHQTASIEGMCGGEPNCRPGEISLAHNGTLFLDEAAEFRSSVLQMLRVPIESKQITLSRAGRTTSYPANFQLAMATNPCPCGCYGSHNKICLDSAKSIDLYWKKFSGPLLDRVEIKTFVEKDENDTRKMSIETMKAQIANAYEIQRKRGVFNSHMTPEQIEQYCKLNSEGQEYLNKESDKLTIREKNNLLKLSLTLANMDGREEIHLNDLKEARELSAPVFEKPRIFKYQPEIIEDPGLTQEHINAAEKERNRIIEPILNGERTGMYKAFKEFEEKGVFDIKGKNVTLAKNGGLTPTGWKQLQAAMEIYRNKKFETFRYIMIDRKTGEIADQLAITSHMPNFCSVSKPNDETLKQVITRAEEKDYLIAVCHNHPSGNTTESSFDRDVTNSLDRSLRNSDGLNRFAGHIILDHNTFNLAVPSEKTPGKCHWKKMDVLNVTEIDPLKEPLSKNPDFKLDDYNIISSSVLISVAQQINDTDNWNDNFVPVVFTNADRGISGVQYYSKNFFENDSNKIRNEFQLTAKEAGAIGAFPVITDNLWNKIPAENRSDFEARMKTHVMNDAFTDVAIDKTTITEKYGIEAGRNYYSLQHEQKDRQVDVDSTWEPSVNSLLFPPEGVGEVDKSNDYKTSPKIKELYLKESKVNIFKDSFIQKEKFVPAIFKNNDKDYIIRVSGNDLINEKYNSINTIYIHMNKNQLQNVLKFHLNNEWNRILDNPASEIKLKIRNPKTLSSNQKELFISKGITDEIKMQKLYADIHKEILFDENNPIVVSKRNFVKQKQIERHNEIQNKKNEFDTDFGY